MKHQRAMDEVEKEERRRQILAAAAELLEASSFDRVSIQATADRCGLAKGTVYLYFKTKEELFLALIAEEFTAWFGDLLLRLEPVTPMADPDRIDEFAGGVVLSLADHPRLLRLLPILHPILERNISFDAALAFKRQLLNQLLGCGEGIERVLAFLQAGQGAELLLFAYAQLIGLQSMAETSPVIRQILLEPGMGLFKVDVLRVLPRVISRMSNGYYIENKRSE
jgi:AcrR family transcriptional regulator